MITVPVSAARVDLCLSHHTSSSTASLCLERLGGLSFVSGVSLTSPSAHFHGLSSLNARAVPSDKLLAITDYGWWVELSRYPSIGQNTSSAILAPLLGEDGEILASQGKQGSDAEGVTAYNTSLLVSFERRQRIWRYPRASSPNSGASSAFTHDAVSLGIDAALSACDGSFGNTGVEAMDLLNATHLVAICEGPGSAGGTDSPAFLIDLRAPEATGSVRRFTYSLAGGLMPSDMAQLPPQPSTGVSRGLLVLERDYTPLLGNRIRLRLITPAAIDAAVVASGRLTGKLLAELLYSFHHVDNFEGIAIEPSADGTTARIFLVSDDNASPHQRTLLYEFTMPLEPMPFAIYPTPQSFSAHGLLLASGMAALVMVLAFALICVCLRKRLCAVCRGMCRCGHKCHRPRCCGGKGKQSLFGRRDSSSTGEANRGGPMSWMRAKPPPAVEIVDAAISKNAPSGGSDPGAARRVGNDEAEGGGAAGAVSAVLARRDSCATPDPANPAVESGKEDEWAAV